jgi:hypothetical protein
MSIEPQVGAGKSNRTCFALKMTGGATLLAGIVAVGVAAIPSSMLRSPERVLPGAGSGRSAVRVSAPNGSVQVDDTRSMSAENSEEPDPYASLRDCAKSMSPSPTQPVAASATSKGVTVSKTDLGEPNE